MTAVQRAEKARNDFDAGRIDSAAAVATIMAALGVTSAGAADLLDHPDSPAVRYAAIGKCVHALPCGLDGAK